jgi:hypothetical protein
MAGGRVTGRLAVLGLVLELAVAACATAPTGDLPTADRSGLQAVVVSTSIWTGDASIVVALSEADASPISDASLAVSGRFTAPASSGMVDPVRVDGRIVHPPGGSRDLVRLDATLPVAGRWTLEVTITKPGDSASPTERRAVTSLTVRDPGSVPMRGDRAPATVTPTLASVGGEVALLTSDSHPLSALYELSVADALAAGSPFMLVLDSAGFKESAACGGALAIVHGLADAGPAVPVIHAEPFRTRAVGGRLTLDPPDGPATLAEWSVDWGLDDPAFGTGSIPWVFVVNRDGVVRAAFQGVMGSEEVALALADVAT